MIRRLRKVLSSALGRGATSEKHSEPLEGTDAGRRIEAARRRLKQAIPPRED